MTQLWHLAAYLAYLAIGFAVAGWYYHQPGRRLPRRVVRMLPAVFGWPVVLILEWWHKKR